MQLPNEFEVWYNSVEKKVSFGKSYYFNEWIIKTLFPIYEKRHKSDESYEKLSTYVDMLNHREFVPLYWTCNVELINACIRFVNFGEYEIVKEADSCHY